MKRTSVFLEDSLLRRLRQKARADGKSFAQCVREAVAAYLEPPRTARPLPGITAMFKSGEVDLSERVDEVLGDTLGRMDPHS